ncbi:uncharacterized protein LOC144141871 [Haemaphysalis longicornis]
MEPDKNWIACPWCGKRFLPAQGETFPTSTASTAAAASSRTMKDEFEAFPMTRTDKKPPEACASRRLVQNETPQKEAPKKTTYYVSLRQPNQQTSQKTVLPAQKGSQGMAQGSKQERKPGDDHLGAREPCSANSASRISPAACSGPGKAASSNIPGKTASGNTQKQQTIKHLMSGYSVPGGCT